MYGWFFIDILGFFKSNPIVYKLLPNARVKRARRANGVALILARKKDFPRGEGDDRKRLTDKFR